MNLRGGAAGGLNATQPSTIDHESKLQKNTYINQMYSKLQIQNNNDLKKKFNDLAKRDGPI